MIDKDLFKLLGSNKKYIFIVVILEILSLVSVCLFSYSFASIINITIENISNIHFSLYTTFSILLIVSIIVRILCDIFTVRIKDELSYNVKYELRNKLFETILTNNTTYSNSALTQLGLEGIEQLDMYYSDYIPQFFYAVISPFILFVFNAPFNIWPSLTLLIFVPFIPVSIILVSKYAKKIFAKYWDKYLSMGQTFLDLSSGLKDLKIFKSDLAKHKEMNAEAEEFRQITMKVLIMQLASTTIMDLVAYGGAAVGIVVAICSRDVYTSYTGLIFLILSSIEFFLPMRRFGSAFHIGMNGATAGKKILSIINKKEEVFGTKEVVSTNITIKDLSYSYDGLRDVLTNINMEFGKSGLYSIVGKSGCGKSTIVKLLKGEIKTDRGLITIGNTNLYDLSRTSYYSHLAIISYNSYILSMSLRDNFRIFKPDITDDECFKYLRDVNLDLFVKHEGGLDLVLNEESNNISGGERQRLALALSLASDKDIYIFDEATSSIDIDSEKIIIKKIKELSKTKLVILISHRLFNVVSSDNIFYLEDGGLKESGTHKELIEANSGYAMLYNRQKSEEDKYKEVVNYE